ncbi:glycosyltransferase family 2 protein [Cohnella pontilimi]|uniref:Glycosyltransferase family 2 protein n=1 Tax=Cohnella pontilimi TaxID=2564100 RepID=A0A4U0FBY6_9BACL|nr:glycosyltransferase family 2 protein [Cohnella pontilimi]TJY40732.1 glycosyltransferase family 2 protein [Cohnella pontilimi]
MKKTAKGSLVSILVPVYNESPNILEFYFRMTRVMSQTGYRYEMVFINDGSRDDTLDKLYSLRDKDQRVKIIDLSRNFGKEIAMTAGLDHCRGDAVIPIDADLQDPPEVIPELIAKWEEGYEVVYATRTRRDGETLLKKATAHLFYRFVKRLTPIPIPKDTGDFRLMSRKVVDALKQLREQHRFMKGLFSWVGFRQTSVTYRREPRYAGRTKFNYWKLWNFAVEGITSFSFMPLQVATYLGFGISLFAIAFALYLFTSTLLYGNPVPGYPSLMVTVLFLGGVQLTTLGVIGEYIGRIYNESKRRPLYFVQGKAGLEDGKEISRLEGVN